MRANLGCSTRRQCKVRALSHNDRDVRSVRLREQRKASWMKAKRRTSTNPPLFAYAAWHRHILSAGGVVRSKLLSLVHAFDNPLLLFLALRCDGRMQREGRTFPSTSLIHASNRLFPSSPLSVACPPSSCVEPMSSHYPCLFSPSGDPAALLFPRSLSLLTG